MERRIIVTADAPAAIGPYSQAVRLGELVFTSGQIAMDPETGQLIDGDVRAQTERVMQNLAAVLSEADSSFDRVLKATIFLVDMADFAVVNEVYGSRFAKEPPARSCVAVAALPRGASVEIEVVALSGP
jgi:2-iminobutanoate/2-iminopropanoate deaminase